MSVKAFRWALVASLGLLSVPAGANCVVGYQITSISQQEVSYLYTPGVDPATSENQLSITSAFDAAFWALGSGNPVVGAGNDSGALEPYLTTPGTPADWIFTYPGYPPYIFGNWAQSPAVDGCIISAPGPYCTVVLLEDRVDSIGYYALLSDLGDANIAFDFIQPDGGHIVLAEIPPAPVVAQAPVDASTVRVTLEAPQTSDGDYLGCGDEHVGYRIYRQTVARGDAPPSSPLIADGDWVPSGDVVAAGEGAEIDIDCSSGGDVFLASQLIFDSGYSTKHVSTGVRVSCAGCAGTDSDGDGFCADDPMLPDCDDTDAAVFPGAPQLCDGRNNDCDAADWPLVPAAEIDSDEDLLAPCQGDCDDTSPEVSAAADERCNALDDDCDGVVDDRNGFLDLDDDGIAGACDNCPFDFNPDQSDICNATSLPDADGDGEVDATDACPDTPDGAAVDSAGCSLAEFCGRVSLGSFVDQLICVFSDWRNDEPLMPFHDRDCTIGVTFGAMEADPAAVVGPALEVRPVAGFGLGGPAWSCVPN